MPTTIGECVWCKNVCLGEECHSCRKGRTALSPDGSNWPEDDHVLEEGGQFYPLRERERWTHIVRARVEANELRIKRQGEREQELRRLAEDGRQQKLEHGKLVSRGGAQRLGYAATATTTYDSPTPLIPPPSQSDPLFSDHDDDDDYDYDDHDDDDHDNSGHDDDDDDYDHDDDDNEDDDDYNYDDYDEFGCPKGILVLSEGGRRGIGNPTPLPKLVGRGNLFENPGFEVPQGTSTDSLLVFDHSITTTNSTITTNNNNNSSDDGNNNTDIDTANTNTHTDTDTANTNTHTDSDTANTNTHTDVDTATATINNSSYYDNKCIILSDFRWEGVELPPLPPIPNTSDATTTTTSDATTTTTITDATTNAATTTTDPTTAATTTDATTTTPTDATAEPTSVPDLCGGAHIAPKLEFPNHKVGMCYGDLFVTHLGGPLGGELNYKTLSLVFDRGPPPAPSITPSRWGVPPEPPDHRYPCETLSADEHEHEHEHTQEQEHAHEQEHEQEYEHLEEKDLKIGKPLLRCNLLRSWFPSSAVHQPLAHSLAAHQEFWGG